MEFLQLYMDEYRLQLKKGMIQKAYLGLMEYMSSLRTYFQKNYPIFDVSGNLYPGYMDMTYFSIIPPSLKPLKLKLALVYLHEAARFEIWLCGVNKQVQAYYWQKIHESGWNKYDLVKSIKGADSIIENVLILTPNFDHAEELTDQIDQGVLEFIKDVEGYLARDESGI